MQIFSKENPNTLLFCDKVLLCHLAEDRTLNIRLLRVVSVCRLEFIEVTVFEDGLLLEALQLCHTVKLLREIHPNLVPVPHPALDATNAVVVEVAQLVHLWQLNPRVLKHR